MERTCILFITCHRSCTSLSLSLSLLPLPIWGPFNVTELPIPWFYISLPTFLQNSTIFLVIIIYTRYWIIDIKRWCTIFIIINVSLKFEESISRIILKIIYDCFSLRRGNRRCNMMAELGLTGRMKVVARFRSKLEEGWDWKIVPIRIESRLGPSPISTENLGL